MCTRVCRGEAALGACQAGASQQCRLGTKRMQVAWILGKILGGGGSRMLTVDTTVESAKAPFSHLGLLPCEYRSSARPPTADRAPRRTFAAAPRALSAAPAVAFPARHRRTYSQARLHALCAAARRISDATRPTAC